MSKRNLSDLSIDAVQLIIATFIAIVMTVIVLNSKDLPQPDEKQWDADRPQNCEQPAASPQ